MGDSSGHTSRAGEETRTNFVGLYDDYHEDTYGRGSVDRNVFRTCVPVKGYLHSFEVNGITSDVRTVETYP